MTVEFVLLLTIFVTVMMSAIVKGPKKSFLDAGPKLGAIVEYHLSTGGGFKIDGGKIIEWKKPPSK